MKAYRFIVILLVFALFASLSACSFMQYNGESDELDYVGLTGEAAADTDSSSDSAYTAPSPTAAPIPDNTSEPAGSDTTFITLKKGVENEDVKEVQVRLIELGYLHTEATGYFGDATVSAVSSFQRTNGIEATGEVDEATYTLLMSDEAKECELPLTGVVIGIDAGCQRKSDHDQEQVAPDSTDTKNKATSGAQGSFTGTNEFDINMSVAKLLKAELEKLGATVIMTHDSVDVNMSGIERAGVFNNNNVMLGIVIRCNFTDDSSNHGAFCMIPAGSDREDGSTRAAEAILSAYCKATDTKNLGVLPRYDQTVLNWSECNAVCLELGHLSNKHDDTNLSDSVFQARAAKAIAEGIESFFRQ